MAAVGNTSTWHDRFTVGHRLLAIGALTVLSVLLAGLMHEKTIADLDVVDAKLRTATNAMGTLDEVTGGTKWQDALALRLMESQKSLGDDYTIVNLNNLNKLEALKAYPLLADSATQQLISHKQFDTYIRAYAADKERMGLTPKSGLRGTLRNAKNITLFLFISHLGLQVRKDNMLNINSCQNLKSILKNMRLKW